MKSFLVSNIPLHLYLHFCGLFWNVCWLETNFGNLCSHSLTFDCFSFQAHNRNLLSIDFDQNTRVGKIYDDHRKFTLHIQYDPLGRPVVWSPSSKYTEVNISYSAGGLLSAIHRGEWSERLEYKNDKLVSRAWVNGKIWSYTYADRVRTVLTKNLFRWGVIDCLCNAEICLVTWLVFFSVVRGNTFALLQVLHRLFQLLMKPKLALKVQAVLLLWVMKITH